jgi:hypothetical protein
MMQMAAIMLIPGRITGGSVQKNNYRGDTNFHIHSMVLD